MKTSYGPEGSWAMSEFPKMICVRQKFPAPKLEEVTATTAAQLDNLGVTERIAPGSTVAVAVGSRGIANLSAIVGTVVGKIKSKGAYPCIVPAMGSHGGATAKGQEEVLASYGITSEGVGAPVHSSMEVVQLGTVDDGVPVYFDKLASEADSIILVNRVKPHTNFQSDLESGLTKMATVGLGKHAGATIIHSHGIYGLKHLIPQMTELVLESKPNIFGVAIVENAYEQTARVVAVQPETLVGTEKRLLLEAKELMASLPSDSIDVLLIEEMGKNISGTGTDTNIIGRIYVRGQEEPETPDINYIGVLDITSESHGNAIGIGYADLTTRRLVENIDFYATYTNATTAVFPALAKIPITLETDRELAEVAMSFMEPKPPDEVRLVRIRNTLDLELVEVSEALWKELANKSEFQALSELRELTFDAESNIECLPSIRTKPTSFRSLQ